MVQWRRRRSDSSDLRTNYGAVRKIKFVAAQFTKLFRHYLSVSYYLAMPHRTKTSVEARTQQRAWVKRDVRHFRVGVVVVMGIIWLVYPNLQPPQPIFAEQIGCRAPVSSHRAIRESLLYTATPPNRTNVKPFTSVLGSYRILSLPSNKVNIRAVYLDPRPSNGFNNASVFLVEIHRELGKKGGGIVACGTSVAVSKALKIRVVKNIKWVHDRHPEINHDMAMIDCFGLPANTSSGARVFLWYRIKDGGDLYLAESEQPYFVPLANERQNKPSIVVCMAVLRDNPPYIKEFLRYYKHLGVDHVYMMADESFVWSGVLNGDKFVQELIKDGFVSFSSWHRWLTKDMVYGRSQMLAYENCIYRFQGTYDYAFFVDSDDHFIPLDPNQKKLDYYIKHYCTGGACTFQWKEYFPDCGQDWSRLGPHGNVTNTLLSHMHTNHISKRGKSIYRISAALDAGIHTPKQLMEGYKSQIVPSNVSYVAHLRKNRAPPNGFNSC